jgi:hypothetical protein
MEFRDKSGLTDFCSSMELSASFMTIRFASIIPSADGNRGIAILSWRFPDTGQAAIPAEIGQDKAIDWAHSL